MVADNTESMRTAFTVSVDVRQGTSTGISAYDRAATIQSLVDPATRPADLLRPGHIFPLAAREGGVLKRAGHTEAALDLARLAGLYPGRRAVRGRQREEGRHGAGARARAVRRRARPAADLDRRPRALPPPDREAGPAHHRGPPAHPVGRLHLLRLRVDPRRHRAPGLREGRGAGRGRRAGAGPLRVPDRRRVLLPALRLRPPAGRVDAAHRRGGPGRGRLPAGPRGPGHRHRPQAAGLPAAGRGPRHRRRQPGARPAGRQPRVRHRLRRCWSTWASPPCG